MTEPGELRPGEAGLAINRVLDAPREAVWREWTTPEAFADWYGGTEAEIPVDTVEMDVQPGGTWKATMYAGPRRREIQWEGEYLEVEPPERLVFTVTDQPGEDGFRDRITVVLIELEDGRTEMRMTQTGGGLPPEGYEAAKAGWGKFLDRMEARLT
jgi:uncharacterized protein YndB with AHSA1/START domain